MIKYCPICRTSYGSLFKNEDIKCDCLHKQETCTHDFSGERTYIYSMSQKVVLVCSKCGKEKLIKEMIDERI